MARNGIDECIPFCNIQANKLKISDVSNEKNCSVS